MTLAQTIPLADTWMHGGWGWGWMSLMMVMMLLFWGAIIAGIVWLIRGAPWGATPRGQNASKETPAEILERRFAEGEIGEEDYRARRAVLAGRGEPLARA
jgi:putative membrane protein